MPAHRSLRRRSCALPVPENSPSSRVPARDETAVLFVTARRRPLNGAGGPRLASWQERKATKFVLDHIAEPIDIGELARSCRVSRGYFISAFCASTGLTPHQWLICFRIRLAQELLLTTDRPLVEIAVDCGFYDQSHFTSTFARWTGESPGRWRRNAKAISQSG